MARTITLQDNQTIQDVIIQEYGSLEAGMDFCEHNSISITDEPAAGTVYEVPELPGKTNTDMLRTLTRNVIKIGTRGDDDVLLELIKSVEEAGPYNLGDTITYVITVTNNNEAAAAVTLTDLLDATLEFVASDPDFGIDAGAEELEMEFTVPGKEVVTIRITCTINSYDTGTVTNTGYKIAYGEGIEVTGDDVSISVVAPPPLALRVLLYPVMVATPTSPVIAPGTSGFYDFTLDDNPAAFICHHGLFASYPGANPIRYVGQSAWFAGSVGAIQNQFGSPAMTAMSVRWRVPYPGPVSKMLIYRAATGLDNTLTFIDVNGNKAAVSPLLILDTTSQTILNYLVPTLQADLVSGTGGVATVRFTKSQAAYVNSDIVSTTLNFIGIIGGYPDPADPSNPDVILADLPAGIYKVGVTCNYVTALPGISTFPPADVEMVIEIF